MFHLNRLQSKNAQEKELCVECIDRLDAASTRAYIPDPPTSLDFPDLPVDRSKTQTNGYLFCRRYIICCNFTCVKKFDSHAARKYQNYFYL